jgi:L-aspartate semialdehyde sulfurtransferase ferredoxin
VERRAVFSVCCSAACAADPPRATPVKTKKNIHFEFSQELVREPLLYKINRSFDVESNIRGASVTEKGGFIALELIGEEAEVERVLSYLRGQGVNLGEGLGSPER